MGHFDHPAFGFELVHGPFCHGREHAMKKSNSETEVEGQLVIMDLFLAHHNIEKGQG